MDGHNVEVHTVDEGPLARVGVDLERFARDRRRPSARLCLDWSVRRHHLAGTLGAALAARLTELEWVRSMKDTRALTVTPQGWTGLHQCFGITRLDADLALEDE